MGILAITFFYNFSSNLKKKLGSGGNPLPRLEIYFKKYTFVAIYSIWRPTPPFTMRNGRARIQTQKHTMNLALFPTRCAGEEGEILSNWSGDTPSNLGERGGDPQNDKKYKFSTWISL